MKIRFKEAPKGREFEVGQVVEFKGAVEISYARKYIARGWAEEVVDEKPSTASPQADRAQPRRQTADPTKESPDKQ